MNPRNLAVALSALLLLAAASADPLELVRQGNVAFAQQDFTKAIDLYEQAASHSTDPGLVAGNQAAALYRLGRFREAELHYRRALEDAAGSRRGRLLFEMGNSLLQQSNGNDAQQLADAVACYRQAQELADDNLASDLRHNLELAKLLWLKARAAKPKQDNGNDAKDEPPPKKDKKEEPKDVKVGPEPGKEPKTAHEVDPKGVKGDPIKTDQAPPPGSNPSLQPIPDKEELVLPIEDTLRHLQRAAEQIQRERREHMKRSAPLPLRGVMDW